MKKVILGITTIVLILSLNGCNSGVVKKSIEQAKEEIESKEYNSALNSLNLALEKDKDNEEAQILHDIIESFKNLEALIAENKFDEANDVISKMNTEYKNYAIKEDIEKNIAIVDNYYKEVEQVDNCLLEAEKLFNENQYEQSKSYLIQNIIGSESDSILANKYATEPQKAKALQLLSKCTGAIAAAADAEAKRVAQQQSVADSGSQNNQDPGVPGYISPEKLKEIQDKVDEALQKIRDNIKVPQAP